MVAERAKSEGYKVELVIVVMMLLLEENKIRWWGEGLAGTAFIHKILGSASATSPDVDLKSLSDLGHAINKNLVTLGASLDRTSVPGKWKKKLNSQEMMKWNWDWVFIMNLVLK